MSLYRCAACGSPNVVTDVQSGGISYNYKKGIAGTIVLGVGGAVAGVESSTQRVYKCQECGMTLTYAMPNALKEAIDRGLASEDARSFLYAEGYGQLTWSLLKKQYRNIEEGLADRMIEDRANMQKAGLLSYATATQEEFDNAVDVIVDFERRLALNGSIYDKLPDDAFSDTQPMTLVEYFVWQDAIALFIENVAKYLPNFVDYRGLSKYHMVKYFGTYLYEKIRIEYGQIHGINAYKELEDYSKNNPFVLYFADKYFPKSFVPFGQIDRKIIPWDPKKFRGIQGEMQLIHGIPGVRDIIFKFKDSNDKEILVTHKLPCYTVKDGRISFWRESNPHNRVVDKVGLMEDYFSIYPEKRSEFDERVDTHKKQLAEKGTIEANLKASELAVSKNQERIKEIKGEVGRLQNKLFGKKKALAEADKLEQEIKQIEEKTKELEASADTLKQKLNQIVNDKNFYEQLVEEMDYFTVWRWADDAERIPFWEKPHKKLNSEILGKKID